MKREEKFREFLDESFGEHITNKLLNKSTLSLNKGQAEVLYQGDLYKNKNQVLNLIQNPIHNADIKKNTCNWAFDFPGWIGDLDFTKENIKDILVIGLEPHIGDKDKNGVERTSQVTYGLRETGENEFFELGEYQSNRILWNNLKNIFSEVEEYYLEKDFQNNKINRQLLEKIYITDMSHFAVKGLAKEANIPDWKNIRQNNAEKYILETINFIKPKYIISQGSIVADFIDNLLFKNEIIENEIRPEEFNFNGTKNRYFNFPHFKSYNVDSNIIHIKLPHLSSGLTNGFWLPNVKNTKDLNKKRSEARNEKMREIRNRINDFAI
jgi:hypothetical protein